MLAYHNHSNPFILLIHCPIIHLFHASNQPLIHYPFYYHPIIHYPSILSLIIHHIIIPLAIILLVYHHIIMPVPITHHQLSNIPSYHAVISSYHHSFIISYHNTIIPSHYQAIIPSYHHIMIHYLLFDHLVIHHSSSVSLFLIIYISFALKSSSLVADMLDLLLAKWF